MQNHKNHRIEKVEIADCTDTDYFLGIDSGSTTTKVVLIDAAGTGGVQLLRQQRREFHQAVQNGLGEAPQGV